MRPVALVLYILFLGAWSTGHAADGYAERIADAHIVPRYQRLADSTRLLAEAAAAQCGQGEDSENALQGSFSEAFLAWQGVQHLRLGPVTYLSRDFRFQLWPDKRGAVSRHLAQLLAGGDPSRLEAERFASGSAAVQGFGALELLLFRSPDPALDPDWYCQVVSRVSANLAQMAADTLADWTAGADPYRAVFAGTGVGSVRAEYERPLSGQLLNNLHTQLERMVTQKLDEPLGTTPGRTFPRRAEAWRSGLSRAALVANLAALKELYDVALAPRLDDADLDRRLRSAFDEAARQLHANTEPLDTAVTQPDAWAALDALRGHLAALKALVAAELASALGVGIGFNSLDGD